MSTTDELRNLVNAAAVRLAEEDNLKHLHDRAYTANMSSETRTLHSQYLGSAAAAMAYAEATLRLVAACLVEEPTHVDATDGRPVQPAARKVASGRAGRGRQAVRDSAAGSFGT